MGQNIVGVVCGHVLRFYVFTHERTIVYFSGFGLLSLNLLRLLVLIKWANMLMLVIRLNLTLLVDHARDKYADSALERLSIGLI